MPWKTLGELWEHQNKDIGNKSNQLEACLETTLNKIQPEIPRETPSYTNKIVRMLKNQNKVLKKENYKLK